jgi:hypothetical protein
MFTVMCRGALMEHGALDVDLITLTAAKVTFPTLPSH